MSPLNKQQLEQIRDERREQIKQAALKVFARRGVANTKISLIAAEAGISEGLIYRYFKSKDELLIVLVRWLTEEARKEMGNVRHLPGTPVDQIRALTLIMLDESNKYAFMLMLQLRTADAVPEEVAGLLKQHSAHALVDLLIPVFVKGQQSGDFIAGDPRELLSWYLYVINSLIMLEAEKEEYGFPSVDVLMRMLTQ